MAYCPTMPGFSPFGPCFGGYPPTGSYGSCGPYPTPYTHGTGQGNMADTAVGQQGFWPFNSSVDGYAVDLNHNGGYERGQDGVLAFDLNHDGQISNEEIEGSNDRLKSFGGNYDMNGNGHVTPCEKFQGQQYQNEMKGKDLNHNGVLESNEIASAGGRMMVDGNTDGQFQPWEQYSPYSYPTPGFGTGSLGYVDPAHSYTQSWDTHFGWGWC